jgi:long-chain acyl-CoA synthetase
MCVCCPESPRPGRGPREIGPTYFFAPPRVFENLLTQIMVRMEDAGWLKKRMFHYFLGVARRCGEQILNGNRSAPWTACLWFGQRLRSRCPCATAWASRAPRVAYTAGGR